MNNDEWQKYRQTKLITDQGTMVSSMSTDEVVDSAGYTRGQQRQPLLEVTVMAVW